jgi:hypothetical protein
VRPDRVGAGLGATQGRGRAGQVDPLRRRLGRLVTFRSVAMAKGVVIGGGLVTLASTLGYGGMGLLSL